MTEENESKTVFIVTFSDFLSILRKHSGRIKFCAATCAIIALLYALSQPIYYETKAVYHQKGKSTAGLNSEFFQTLFAGAQPESEGIIAMKSMRLSKELVRQHGMQAFINKESYSFPFLPLATIGNNLKVELALWKGSPFPVLEGNPPAVMASDVFYDKITPLSLSLEVVSPHEYLLKKNGNVVAAGIFGQPLATDEFAMVLEFRGDPVKDLGKYSFSLQPLHKIAEHVQKAFNISSDISDKNLVTIQYKHPYRDATVDHVNTLMGLYQKYVDDEHRKISAAQLEYLLHRQQVMGDQLRDMMQKHAEELSSDLSSTGFATTEMAMEFLATNQQSLRQKLLTLELEIQRLDSISRDDISDFDKFLSIGTSDWVNTIIAEMRSLKQQADSLSLALRSSDMAKVSYEEAFNKQLAELDEIKQSAQDSQTMLTSLQRDMLPKAPTKLLNNPRFIVKAWYDRLVASRESSQEQGEKPTANWQRTKEGFSSYLTHLIDYLQVHQRNIEERLNHQQSFHEEFQGISPNTAKELYIAYCRELSEQESKALKLKYIITQMSDPEFEISSLSTVLDDATSNEMISKATNTSLTLKDTENRSSKELDRLKSDLALHRAFLASHLKHTVDLMEINQKLLKEKIYSLQSINLSLLQNEMSVLEQQMKQYIQSTIEAHKRERSLLDQNLNEMRMEMATLPQKWAAEQLIDQQMTINRNMIEEISKLVESKNITSNLEKMQSVPLDLPYHPLHPKSPKVLFHLVAGTLFGMFLGMLWAVGSSVVHGVSASLNNMKAMGMHTSGTLSSRISSKPSTHLLDSDLETLRRLISFMNMPNTSRNTLEEGATGKSLLILGGAGLEYAPTLAELLAKSGLKTAVVDLAFDRPTGSQGLLQYLEGTTKDLKITHEAGYDLIPSGGVCRYANELLTSARFKAAAADLINRYDWVLFYSSNTCDSVEAETLLEIFPRAALTLTEETLEGISRTLSLIAQKNIHTTFLA